MSDKINKNLPLEKRLGQVGLNNNGEKMTIIAYRKYEDIDIQFEDGVIVENKKYNNFLRGKIKHPIRYEESFAYHIEIELGLDINKIWNFEKNSVNPYEIYKCSTEKVWLYCLEKKYHNDEGGYEIKCSSFYNGSRCCYCASKKIHPKDSFAQWGIDNIDKDFLNKYWSKKNVINPFKISSQSNKKVWIYCQEKDYHNEDEGYEIGCNVFYEGHRCGYCYNFKVHKLDSLGYLYPQITQMIITDKKNNVTMKDMYEISSNSNKEFYFKCNKCKQSSSKKKNLNNIIKYKFSCEYCSDNISIPNKMLRQISKQLNLNWKFEYSPSWINRKRLDSYDDNFKIAIEMDAEYSDNHKGERKKIDKWKDEQCLKHGIYVVRIDLMNTKEYNKDTLKYIQRQILNSPLNQIYDLSNIDWGLAWKECQSNLIWEAIELLEKGYTDKEIMDKLKIGIKTIKKCKKIMIKIKDFKME